MGNQLNEAFVVSGKLDQRGNNIAFIDASKPQNSKSFEYKDIFKKHGARWDGANKYWFWYIGKTQDKWTYAYKTFIEPAIKEVHAKEGATEDESQASLVSSLEATIDSAKKASTAPAGTDDESLSPEEQTKLVGGLEKFKQVLVNLDDDEEFKKTMQALVTFKNTQGHKNSFTNTWLIWMQNKNATHVMSKLRWSNHNREVKKDAVKIWIRSPNPSAMSHYSKNQKQDITNKFIQNRKKSNYNDLSIGEKDKLGIILRGQLTSKSFVFTPAYDIKDTIQMEGKEDYTKDMVKPDIKWSEDDMLSEKVRPIYSALVHFAEEHGIKVDQSDDLGGAKGVSGSGKITILKNEGNDVGLTKTLAHEITHELLHQKYLKDNYNKFAKYFTGRPEGIELVEQQAELSAWMIMASYGFDLQTTSLNYVAIWGGDKDAMVKVFDTVTGVVNLLLDEINIRKDRAKQQPQEGVMVEAEVGSLPRAKHITPEDIARILGVQSDFEQVKREVGDQEQQHEGLVENFYRKVNTNIRG